MSVDVTLTGIQRTDIHRTDVQAMCAQWEAEGEEVLYGTIEVEGRLSQIIYRAAAKAGLVIPPEGEPILYGEGSAQEVIEDYIDGKLSAP
jgi:hypothetical protein